MGLSRTAGPDAIAWDPYAGTVDTASLEGLEAVVHFAGEGIADGRWTAGLKRRILESRVRGTTFLSERLAAAARKPAVMVCASAIGYYGDRGDEILYERSEPGRGFMSEVCVKWETSTKAAEDAGIRVVRLRIGLVLARQGGLLGPLLPLFRMGLGGRLGDGKQWMSWVTRDDLVGVVLRAIEDPSYRGPVNLVAPGPVTNTEFTCELANAVGRWVGPPVPRFAARLLMGREFADALLFGSTRVAPGALLERSYPFLHPDLGGALRSVLA